MDRLAELIGWETDGRKGEENRASMRRIYEHLKQQQINADRKKLRREVDNRATRQPVRIRPGSKNLPPAAWWDTLCGWTKTLHATISAQYHELKKAKHVSRFESGQAAKQQRRLKMPYDCGVKERGVKEQRESKSAMFFEAISQLSREVFQLEELASRVVGRVTGATQCGNQVASPEPSPCPALVLNMYPDKLRELRERIQKAKDEIVEALF